MEITNISKYKKTYNKTEQKHHTLRIIKHTIVRMYNSKEVVK